VASFTNTKYDDVVTDSILFAVFYGQMDLVQMPFTLNMHPVYGGYKCFTKPAIHAWFKVCSWLRNCWQGTNWSAASSSIIFASGSQKLIDRWDKC